jgi:hypothetical protein
MICGRSPVLGGHSARSRVCICGKLWTSGASAAVAAWSVVRWIIGAACVEGQKLVRNLYAALGVYKDDHVQRAVEVVALLHCEGFVALSACPLTSSGSCSAVARMSRRWASFPRSSSRVMRSSAAISGYMALNESKVDRRFARPCRLSTGRALNTPGSDLRAVHRRSAPPVRSQRRRGRRAACGAG